MNPRIYGKHDSAAVPQSQSAVRRWQPLTSVMATEQENRFGCEIPCDVQPCELLQRRHFGWSTFIADLSLILLMFLTLICILNRYRLKRIAQSKTAICYRRVAMKEDDGGKVNALVTGAGGCVGRHMVECLLEDGGYNVHCLDLQIPKEEQRNEEVCSYIQADIGNYKDMVIALQGMDAVFHVAGLTPMLSLFFTDEDFYRVNVTGTENIIHACQECNVKRLIYTSSGVVVMYKGWNCRNANESLPFPDQPLDVYTKTKGEAERHVLAANGRNGLVTCALRPAGIIFSKYNPAIHHMLQETTFLMKDTNHGMTFIPGDAAAKAHMLAEKKLRDGLSSIAAGKAYNLGNKGRVLYHQLFGTLESDNETIWGQPPPYMVPRWVFHILVYINYFVHKLTGVILVHKFLSPMCLGYFTEQTFSSSRAHRELGWEELPPWEDIVRKMVKEYREERKMK